MKERPEAVVDPALYQSLVEQLPVSVFLLDASGQGLLFNSSWQKLVGKSAQMLISGGWLDSIHHEDRLQFSQLFGSTIQPAPSNLTIHHRLQSRNSGWLSVQTAFQALLDDSGTVHGLVGVTTEQTSQVPSECQYALDNLMNCLAIDTACEVYFTIKKDYVVHSWSSQAEGWFGRSKEEVIGTGIFDLILQAEGWRQNTVIPEKGEKIAGVALSRDGVEFPVELVICPCDFLKDGFYYARIRQSPYDSLNDMTQELNVQRISMLTDELETFSYSVSHDLRAPLRAIDGFSQILQEDYLHKLDTAGQDYLSRVRTAARRMGGLIDDLLELSRITRHELQLERIDLGSMVQNIVHDLQQAEPDRRVEVDIAADLFVRADAELMRKALLELLDNAWKFTQKRDCVQLHFGEMLKQGRRVFYLRDNGVGFKMEYSDKLFKIFQRLHSAKEYPGEGAGLAVVKKIIDRHHGSVWANSMVGEGAEFYFTIDETDCQ